MKLEQEMINQLKEVFSKIENPVYLRSTRSNHSKQDELEQLLHQLSELSPFIEYEKTEQESRVPSVEIGGQENGFGVRFVGIPGGHEFSSLVLAILGSDHKIKFPDKSILSRIKRLKGEIELKTFMSLSCENCPEVVQAINMMSVINPNIKHTIYDGGLVPELIEELSIGGVPAVVSGKELVLSGKNSLMNILEKLESEFGAEKTASQSLGNFDVVVIGGGPAGVSSAIYSARKGLSVAVVAEKLGGQVKDTVGIENLISIPYIEGPQLTESMSQHLSHYDIQVFEHRRVSKIDYNFHQSILLTSGESLQANSIIIATGARWRKLNIEGEIDYLGKGVAYCPHCDGPLYRGKDVVVVGGGNSGVEAALDLAAIANKVTVVEFGESLRADKVLVEKLKELPNSEVITNFESTQIKGNGKKLQKLIGKDRVSGREKEIIADGVFVQIGLIPNTDFLGGEIELNQRGEIIIDKNGRTSQKAVYAAGDVTDINYKQIIISMGEGAKVALALFEDTLLGQVS